MGRGRRFVAAVAAAALAAAGACSDDAGGGDALAVQAVSTRPEMATGGDVLVRVSRLDAADAPPVTVAGEAATGPFTMEDGTAPGLDTSLPDRHATLK